MTLNRALLMFIFQMINDIVVATLSIVVVELKTELPSFPLGKFPIELLQLSNSLKASIYLFEKKYI